LFHSFSGLAKVFLEGPSPIINRFAPQLLHRHSHAPGWKKCFRGSFYSAPAAMTIRRPSATI
jgi:hypothetical protein